jgi:hypothetical protein
MLQAQTFYVATNGSDANPGTEAQPWQTISKVETMQSGFANGTTVLFRRGDTWTATESFPFTLSKSGISSARIKYGAYGVGNNPVFTGMIQLISWTQVGATRVYESAVINTGDASASTFRPNVVTINGVPYAKGRYPNPDIANKGYLTIDAQSSDKFIITDADAKLDTLNWLGFGAQIATRTNAYILDTSAITAQGANTLTLRLATTYNISPGYGYFIQNDPRTLDQHGEWYYDHVTKKLKIFIAAGNTPANYDIRVAVRNRVVEFTGSYINFSDIDVEGGNVEDIAFNGASAHHLSIKRAGIRKSGSKLIDGNSSSQSFVYIDSCTIEDALNHAADLRDMGDSLEFTNNYVARVGLFPGHLGRAPQQAYGVVTNRGSGIKITKNKFYDVGYVPIRFQSSNLLIKNNLVDNFGLVLDDGGGIYGGYQTDQVERWVNRVIDGNIVLNAIGAPEGKASSAFSNSIYLDDNAHNIKIINNTTYRTSRNALLLHHSWNVEVKNNTFYDFGIGVFFQKNTTTAHKIENIDFKNNKLIAKARLNTTGNQLIYQIDISDTTNSTAGTVPNLGSLDSNYLIRPTTDPLNTNNSSTTAGTFIRVRDVNTSPYLNPTNYTKAQFTTNFGHEVNSKTSPILFLGKNLDTLSRFDYNATDDTATVVITEQYIDSEGSIYNPPSYKLPPWQSRFLMETGVAPPPTNASPTANAGSDIGVTLPYPFVIRDTLIPTHDAYARYSTPTTNYNVDTLVVKTNASNSFTRQSFLKWSLGTISDLDSARVRIYGYNAEDASTITINLYPTTTDAWDEATLNWSTKPDYITPSLDKKAYNSTQAYREFEITNYAKQEAAGDKTISLALLDSAAGTQNKNISLRSSENSSNKPQLIIKRSGFIALNGTSSSDIDGTINTYLWAKTSGPTGGTVASPNSAITSLSNLVTGTYTYSLTVTDDDGAQSTDEVRVIVADAPPVVNANPVANAGADQRIALPTNQVTLNGTGSSDPDGTISTYSWTKLSGGAATITSPSASTTTVTGLAQGSYSFRLTVTDNNSATSTDIINVTVDPAPRGKGKTLGGKLVVTSDGKLIFQQ